MVTVAVSARTRLQRQPDAIGATAANPTLAVGLIRDDEIDSVRIGSVLTDMFYLLRESRPPQDRQWLRPRLRDALTYWVFQAGAVREAAAAVPATR